MNNYYFNAICDRILKKLDLLERRAINKMRDDGKLYFLSELIPYFKNTNIFGFGTGGSITNLENVPVLADYNLMTVSLGPLYMKKVYGFVPNIWSLHYGPTAKEILNLEKETPLDLSDTFIFIPANDSNSPYFFSTPIFKEFRKHHPEATFVLYREHRGRMSPNNIHPLYLELGVEPLRVLGATLEGSFLPFCGFLGVSNFYFSGIDHMHSTGHFWDRKRFYQDMKGNKINFPDEDYALKSALAAQKVCTEKNLNCYRLEAKETILKSYPYIEFKEALAKASSKITPQTIREAHQDFKYED